MSEPAVPDPTVAAALLDYLELEGVTRVFGVPGGALIAFLAELHARRHRITFHMCRQETGAAYIADGYARVSGGLGVVFTTSGPGATNALTGTLNADESYSPLLIVTGEVATEYFGRGYLQEGIDASLDVVDVYGAAVGYSEVVDAASSSVELMCSALRTARGIPNRAAHLSFPADVAGVTLAGYTPPTSVASYRTVTGFVDSAGIAAAVAAIAAAERPLLMLGSTCRRPLCDDGLRSDLVEAVEHLSVPVITDPDAKGVFPESHELSLRNYGLASCEWPKYYMYDHDLGRFDTLVVIGSDLEQLDTNSWDPLLLPTGQFFQIVDEQAMVARGFSVTTGIVGEMTAVLRSFVDAARGQRVDPAVAERRRDLIRTIKGAHSPFADPGARVSPSVPIKPQALMRILGEVLPSRSRFVVDAGNCVGWCLNGLVVDPPTRSHFALALGPMGFAVGAVVGAALADPDATCVAVVGDGGFLMQVGEVATAAQYGIGAIWVILADHELNMVNQGMAHVFRDESYDGYYPVHWTDLAKVAEGLGAAAYSANDPEGAAEALRAAIAGAKDGIPQVVSVEIDVSEIPPYYPPKYPPETPETGDVPGAR